MSLKCRNELFVRFQILAPKDIKSVTGKLCKVFRKIGSPAGKLFLRKPEFDSIRLYGFLVKNCYDGF